MFVLFIYRIIKIRKLRNYSFVELNSKGNEIKRTLNLNEKMFDFDETISKRSFNRLVKLRSFERNKANNGELGACA